MLFFCSVRDYIGAKMSKLPGPSRIPTFGTRIPQPGSNFKSNQDIDPPPISPADVGRRVLAAGKVGILRFVGKVHFAGDIWCGIELDTDVGKNDGSIDGVRYFTCSRTRGLMTPLSKVSIYTDNNRIVKSESNCSISSRSGLQRYDTFEIDVPPLEGVVLEKGDGRQDRTQPKGKIVLRRGQTFDQEKRDDTLFGNTPRTFMPDNNEDRLKRSGSFVKSNIVKKRGSILTCSADANCFQSPDRTEDAPHSTSTPVASTSRFNTQSSRKIEIIDLFRNKGNQGQTDERTIAENKPKNSDSEATDLKRADAKDTTENHSLRTFIFNTQEEDNKRDSLDLDESLEILTASQMNDGFSIVESAFVLDDMSEQKNFALTLPPSNFELMLQENVTLISETTINLDLTLDTTDKSKNFHFTRMDETPSPEELPLDPIPVVGVEPKTESEKSSKSNCFITSITSITSLDTGYQGDGEMSRPGSRGADNSPLTRRPLPRPARRAEAMTDSDFFTESDADNHEENVLKGDRKAQIIDGTLYGVDPQAAADIYVNNRENMDSSGIFTDIESNTRAEELLMDEKIDISPSDTSTKTLSENSQNNVQEVIAKNEEAKKKEPQTENAKKRSTPSPAISNTSSTISPRHLPRDDSVKKYKTLKREVQSKVKTLLDNKQSPKQEKKVLKKPTGRWDAVMNKISKSDSKTNFQEVKSRVFNNVNLNTSTQCDAKKLIGRQVNNQKMPNNKLRRVRTRVSGLPQTQKNSNAGSIHSSLSDLSASVPKKTVGSLKKKDVQQVTQVLTAAKLSPKLPQQNTLPDAKRRPVSAAETKPVRKIFSTKEKKSIVSKENGRNSVKGGRTSPVIRSPTLSRTVATKPAPKTVEALAILVQHLVFNVEAFEVPNLRAKIKRIEEHLAQEKQKSATLLEEEKNRWQEDIADLVNAHQIQLSQIANQNSESEEKLTNQYERSKADLRRYYEEKLHAIKKEYEKLQKSHAESLDILREENEAIREDIDEKNEEIRSAKRESLRLKEDYEVKEKSLRDQINQMSRENHKFKQELAACRQDVNKLEEERVRLAEENKRLLSYGEGKDCGVQEAESLRFVLGIKLGEVSDLRKSLLEAQQKVTDLEKIQEEAIKLKNNNESLLVQLDRQKELEMTLQAENKRLEMLLQEEAKQKRSISLRNEELQYKLEQNKEVVTKILEQTNHESKIDQYLSSSFNSDRYNSNTSLNLSFRNFYPIGRSSTGVEVGSRTPKKPKTSLDEDESPPLSPRVKGVVEKSDSVSYVLDLNESPEVVASRLVRRSFRNSTNQKVASKTTNGKKQRSKGSPLSQSSSASSLISSNVEYQNRSRSVSSRNCDEFSDFNYSDNSSSPSPYHSTNQNIDRTHETRKPDVVDLDFLDDHVIDLTLPALPSELGDKTGVQPLPRPKHLAGEALVSESNSEDECTSSSSGPL
ncbi:restin homolog [Harmonia axyridis]|uniref:restin homolog n=1 Tax=Harmonia axyridis TaxID=115357 RepID=UPI001E27894D|nr:restin homolog [Harmonia axyridis]